MPQSHHRRFPQEILTALLLELIGCPVHLDSQISVHSHELGQLNGTSTSVLQEMEKKTPNQEVGRLYYCETPTCFATMFHTCHELYFIKSICLLIYCSLPFSQESTTCPFPETG